MEQKFLILVDEQPQSSTLEKIQRSLYSDGYELIYKEFNPTHFQKRADGNLTFDEESFKKAIIEIPFFKSADKILCDYNLITGVIDGYDIIKIIRECGYNKKKKIVLYSAEIKDVIGNILKTTDNFETQKENLSTLIENNIDFIERNGYDQETIKYLKAGNEFDIENELISWFQKRNKDTFNNLFPKYTGRSFNEIAEMLESGDDESMNFKKELAEQIISYLSFINDLEDA